MPLKKGPYRKWGKGETSKAWPQLKAPPTPSLEKPEEGGSWPSPESCGPGTGDPRREKRPAPEDGAREGGEQLGLSAPILTLLLALRG